MPIYNYICNNCLKKATKAKGEPLTSEEEVNVMFETSHSMNPTEKELKEASICPRCNSLKTQKCFYDMHVIGYVRGNGYLDREGVQRDINLFHLTGTDAETGKPLDPYGYLRQTGEVDDLANKIKRGGKKGNPKHYVASKSKSTKSLEKAVAKATKKTK